MLLARAPTLIFVLFFGLYILPVTLWFFKYPVVDPALTVAQFGLDRIIERTFALSAQASAVAFGFGGAIAACVVFGTTVWRGTFLGVTVASLCILLIARNLAWLQILTLPSLQEAVAYTSGAVVVVMGTMLTPLAAMLMGQQLRTTPRILLEAGCMSGLKPRQVLWHVVIRPKVWSFVEIYGITFVIAVGYFITPRIVGGGKTDFVGSVVAKLIGSGDLGGASQIGQLLALAVGAVIAPILWSHMRGRK